MKTKTKMIIAISATAVVLCGIILVGFLLNRQPAAPQPDSNKDSSETIIEPTTPTTPVESTDSKEPTSTEEPTVPDETGEPTVDEPEQNTNLQQVDSYKSKEEIKAMSEDELRDYYYYWDTELTISEMNAITKTMQSYQDAAARGIGDAMSPYEDASGYVFANAHLTSGPTLKLFMDEQVIYKYLPPASVPEDMKQTTDCTLWKRVDYALVEKTSIEHVDFAGMLEYLGDTKVYDGFSWNSSFSKGSVPIYDQLNKFILRSYDVNEDIFDSIKTVNVLQLDDSYAVVFFDQQFNDTRYYLTIDGGNTFIQVDMDSYKYNKLVRGLNSIKYAENLVSYE